MRMSQQPLPSPPRPTIAATSSSAPARPLARGAEKSVARPRNGGTPRTVADGESRKPLIGEFNLNVPLSTTIAGSPARSLDGRGFQSSRNRTKPCPSSGSIALAAGVDDLHRQEAEIGVPRDVFARANPAVFKCARTSNDDAVDAAGPVSRAAVWTLRGCDRPLPVRYSRLARWRRVGRTGDPGVHADVRTAIVRWVSSRRRSLPRETWTRLGDARESARRTAPPRARPSAPARSRPDRHRIRMVELPVLRARDAIHNAANGRTTKNT